MHGTLFSTGIAGEVLGHLRFVRADRGGRSIRLQELKGEQAGVFKLEFEPDLSALECAESLLRFLFVCPEDW